MKKQILLLIVALTLLLTSCSSASNTDNTAAESISAPQSASGSAEYQSMDDAAMLLEETGISVDVVESKMAEDMPVPPVDGGAQSDLAQIEIHDKIIYNADTVIETKDYDTTIAGINGLVSTHNGFVESSSVNGVGYNSGGTRYADITIRVPSSSFTEITQNLSNFGNVIHLYTHAQNVTAEYIDIESRLNSYRTQEERLLSMLSSAENLEEMLILESHLVDVRYNIEYYTTNLNRLKNDVDYSTITISVHEVIEYSPENTPNSTFLDEMSEALKDSIDGIIYFAQGLILFVLSSWFGILIIAIIFIVVYKKIKKVVKNRNSINQINIKKDNEDK